MILNKQKYPNIRNGVLTYHNINYLSIHMDKNPGMFWYVEIADIHGFQRHLIDEAVPKHIQACIKNNTLKLIIYNHFEGFHSIVDEIYKVLVIDLCIPEEQIHLYSESFNILDAVINASEKFNKQQIHVTYYCPVENSVAVQQYRDLSSISYDRLPNKKFINLNRRWRPHRPTFVALLFCKKLLSHGYISLSPGTEGANWHNKFDQIKYLNRNSTVCDILENYEKNIISLPPFYLDTEKLDINEYCVKVQDNLIPWYQDSMFSVISETNFYKEEHNEHSIFITEKTYKAMLYKHPFILLSRPYTLQALRDKGYKTFNGIIDESYDHIENDSDRMLAVVNEVERLCNFSNSQVLGFISECKYICDHNYNVLLTKTNLDNCKLTLN